MRKTLELLVRNGPFLVALAVILPLFLGRKQLAKQRRKAN